MPLTEFLLHWHIKILSFLKSWDQYAISIRDSEFESQPIGSSPSLGSGCVWVPSEWGSFLNSYSSWGQSVRSVQSLSLEQLFATLWTAEHQASPSITNSWSSLKLMSIESVMPSNHLILCRPLLLPPSMFPSIRVFSNESALRIRWPKYWSFSFNISPSNEYSGLISLRMDWLDLLAVQGILKSSPTPQFKNINSLVLSFLYSPILTSIHDHWKNHSLD